MTGMKVTALVDRDDRLGNLSWGTRTQNMHDKVRDGTLVNGERHGQSKLTADDVRGIRQKRAAGVTMKSLAEEYGVHIVTVHDVIYRKTWFHI